MSDSRKRSNDADLGVEDGVSEASAEAAIARLVEMSREDGAAGLQAA